MSLNIKVSPFVKQCFVTAAVGINIIGYGSALGFPAILLPQLKEPGSDLHMTKEEESWLASIISLFLLVGNFIAAPVMDKLGRKTAHYALTVPSIIGWLILIVATNVNALLFARAILGLAYGLLNNLRSVLIGEYTSPKNRGGFLTTISLTQAFGVFLVHLLGSFLSWQITALICTFFSFTSLLMIIYTPESPSWLAGRGRYEECREVFRWLRGDEEEEELNELINARIDLKEKKNINDKAKDNWIRTALKSVGKREFYKPIILMIHANVLMQFSGATTITNYATVILTLIMGPTANVYFWMVFLDTQRIITNTAAVFVINRTKRRTMMFVYGGICVISYLAISLYVYGKIRGLIPFQGVWFPAVLVNIQMFTVGMAMVPMPSIIAGEVFPLEYRGIGGTISMASLAIIAFLVVKTFPDLIDTMGLEGTYFFYSIILTYCLFVIWLLLPETKGRTLQEIEDELKGRASKPCDAEGLQPLTIQTELLTDTTKQDKEVLCDF